jgi:nucleoside-diphosphate-sugar epimerase
VPARTAGEAVHALIVGGSGFVGRHLTQSLTEAGQTVVIGDLVAPKGYSNAADYVRVDVRDRASLSALPPAHTVYNLAAVHRTPGHPEHEYYETNVRGALNVCDFASSMDCPEIVFTSSISVYGPVEAAVNEASPLRPNSSYGRSKALAEEIHAAWAAADASARRLSVVRPAVIFGLGENGNFTRLAEAMKRNRFAFPGRTDTIKSCGYVKDIVVAMQFMRPANPGITTYNYCYEQGYTIFEICEAFCTVAGYRFPRRIPPRVIDLGLRVAALGNGDAQGSTYAPSRIQKLVASTNIRPQALADAGFLWPSNLTTALEDWMKDSRSEDFE